MTVAAAARAEVRLEVGGHVEERSGRLAVALTVRNTGDAACGSVDIEGELLGHYEEERLDPGPAAGGQSEIKLYYPLPEEVRPGVHPLALHLRFTAATPGSALVNQRAYLLLALGANPEPAVRLFVSPARFETRGTVLVGLESADGQPHRVGLRLLAPRGLNPFGAAPAVDVPASGRVTARLDLLRGSAPRPSRHGIVVLAAAADGPLERTSVALGEVEVLPDAALLPRMRWLLAAVAVALLAAGVGVEVWRRWPAPTP
ncbi:MAG TPA: hypothetical protein VF310_11715 [Vicinamibacteria bacterium]